MKIKRPESPGIYTGIRLIPVFLGLIFALAYSRLMGIEIRSIFSFILVTNTLISFLFMSGLCLHIKKSKTAEENKNLVQSYLLLTFVLSLFSSGTMFCVVILFEKLFKINQGNSLPTNAITAIMIYSVISNINMPITELLATLQNLRALVFTEIAVVLMQIFIFITLVTIGETTYFVSALMAYSMSYAFSIFGSLVVLVSLGYFSLQPLSSFRTIFGMELLKNYGYGFIYNLTERFERVLFGFFYSTPQLAQVSTYSSILAMFRIVPDTKIRLSHHNKFIVKNISLPQEQPVGILSYALPLTLLGVLSNLLIYVALGPSWLLPLPVMLALTIYEFFIWKSKVSIEQLIEKHSRRKALKLMASLVVFFLFLLPVLMLNLSYEFALSISVLFLVLWFRVATPSKPLAGV